MSGSVEIIMMHRVLPEALSDDDPYHKITVTTAQLERYLEARKGWRALHLNDLMSGDIPAGKNYVVTFDDGYLDNRTHALPLLEAYNVPATIFCGIDFIEGTLEPFEILLDKLLKQTDMPRDERQMAYARLFRRFKKGALGTRLGKLHNLANMLKVAMPDISQDDFMRWEDVIALDQHPLITIGSHAASHTVLWKMNPITIWGELKKSRDVLQEKLGRDISLISYPYGRHNRFTRLFARMCGYELGCITDPGAVSDGFSRYTLPRFELNEEFLEHHV